MSESIRAAFYDFDGTIVTSNVVTRYAFFAKNHPSRSEALLRYGKLLATVPFWIALNFCSRRLFNEVFYRQYHGMRRKWLAAKSEELFEKEIKPKIYPGAQELLDDDRQRGFRLVLLSGGLDFALAPVVRYFGFHDLICNQLVYENGVASGEVASPLLAGQAKVAAVHQFCREYNVDTTLSKAYSDSFSDLPMLSAVGLPNAVNPDCRLRRMANSRGWPVLNL